MGQKICRAISTAVIVAPLAACTMANPTALRGDTNQAAAVAYDPSISSVTKHVGVCLDASGSTPASFADAMQEDLANAVATWVTSIPSTAHAVSAQPGLDLTIRFVLTVSYTSSAPFVHIHVPSVNGLKPELDATDPRFIEDDPVWVRERSEVLAAAKAAVVAAGSAARTIKSTRLVRQASEIAGCVSALAATAPRGPRAFVVFSDGEQNQAPQLSGDFSDTELLWIQPCPAGIALHCQAVQINWRQKLEHLGAAPVTFTRPEDITPEALQNFMKGA
jgi:hypothetical protein